MSTLEAKLDRFQKGTEDDSFLQETLVLRRNRTKVKISYERLTKEMGTE